MWVWVAGCLLAGVPAPASDRFSFALHDVPVGSVELSLTGSRYTYTSTQGFARAGGAGPPRSRRQVWKAEVDAQGRLVGGVHPASLWLWKGPSEGCVPGQDELGGKRGPLCAGARQGERQAGTVFGEAFEARFGAGGRLESLRLGDSAFTRVKEQDPVPLAADPFSAGFAVEGGPRGALTTSPPQRPSKEGWRTLDPVWSPDEALALAQRAHQSLEGKEGVNCVDYARRLLALAEARPHSARWVRGVVVEGGRAYPHAWVEVGLRPRGVQALDPTSLAPVTAQTHLELLDPAHGYLELLAGRAMLSRRAER